jgi:hypothetical protein
MGYELFFLRVKKREDKGIFEGIFWGGEIENLQ